MGRLRVRRFMCFTDFWPFFINYIFPSLIVWQTGCCWIFLGYLRKSEFLSFKQQEQGTVAGETGRLADSCLCEMAFKKKNRPSEIKMSVAIDSCDESRLGSLVNNQQ